MDELGVSEKKLAKSIKQTVKEATSTVLLATVGNRPKSRPQPL